MIGHILKKDLLLLWPLVVVVAALQAVDAALTVLVARFELQGLLVLVARLLPWVAVLGMGMLAVAVVHQDALPGAREDWLVRPIRHRDLLLAKLLFCLIFVLGPPWLADCILGPVNGFSLWASVRAADERGLILLCLFVLPAFIVAAVTRSLIEVLMTSLGTLALCIGTWLILTFSGVRPGMGGGSWSWLVPAAWSGLAVLAAFAVLRLQYFGRRTVPARTVVAMTAALTCLVPLLMSWRQGYAMNVLLASEPPAAADAVSLAFHPDQGPIRGVPSQTRWPCGNPCAVSILLPLKVSAVPIGALVVADRTEVHIWSRDGNDPSPHELYHGFANISIDGTGSIEAAQLKVRSTGEATSAREKIFLPLAVFRLLENRTVRLELDYDLTLLRPRAPLHIAAIDGEAFFGEFGRCATKVDSDQDAVAMLCQSLSSTQGSCFTAVLENASSGERNPEIWRCMPDYGPQIFHRIPTGVFAVFGLELPFRDVNGLATYPVEAAKLTHARLTVQPYEPRAHFQRHLVIPDIRLGDWQMKAAT